MEQRIFLKQYKPMVYHTPVSLTLNETTNFTHWVNSLYSRCTEIVCYFVCSTYAPWTCWIALKTHN
jgi:hypothetical protein